MDELKCSWNKGQDIQGDEIIGATGRRDYLYQAGPRYNFCLLVDDVCLESLDKMSCSVAKIIERCWVPDEQDLEHEEEGGEESTHNWEGGMTSSEFEDVGWMYTNVSEYVELQSNLQEGDNWVHYFVRPPLIAFSERLRACAGVLAQEQAFN